MLTLRTSFIVLLVACLPANDLTIRTSEIDDRAQRDTGDDYDFQHLSVDGYVQQKPGFYPVHAASDWRTAWTEDPKGNVPAVPADVDFKKRMLFVATSKTPGAKSIEVQKITRTADGLHIYVLETLLPKACPPQATKAVPMDLVSLDNVPFDMHVVYDRVHADSCGPPPDAVVACRIAGSGAAGSDKITASPGEVIDCDSSQSRAQVGTINVRTWQLNVSPPGSATKLTVGKGNVGVTFPVDAWGVYQVGLDIRDATREGSSLGIIEVLPPTSGVELYFTHAANLDAAALPRVELHVTELPFGLGSSGDCGVQTQKSWCEMHTAVGLQLGTLNPEKNKRYRVGVKYLDVRLPGGPNVCVRAFAKGILPVSACDAEDGQRARNAVWDLGALDVAHATFYDARLSKPPVVIAATVDAGAPVPTTAATLIVPPPPTATATATHAKPPPPPPPTATAVIEL
jgi:hypothetical protein